MKRKKQKEDQKEKPAAMVSQVLQEITLPVLISKEIEAALQERIKDPNLAIRERGGFREPAEPKSIFCDFTHPATNVLFDSEGNIKKELQEEGGKYNFMHAGKSYTFELRSKNLAVYGINIDGLSHKQIAMLDAIILSASQCIFSKYFPRATTTGAQTQVKSLIEEAIKSAIKNCQLDMPDGREKISGFNAMPATQEEAFTAIKKPLPLQPSGEAARAASMADSAAVDGDEEYRKLVDELYEAIHKPTVASNSDEATQKKGKEKINKVSSQRDEDAVKPEVVESAKQAKAAESPAIPVRKRGRNLSIFAQALSTGRLKENASKEDKNDIAPKMKK